MLFFDTNFTFIDDIYRSSEKIAKLELPPIPTDIFPPPKRITVCTTCMNRLYDLRQTLPVNLEDNRDYSNAQFLLLDYGGTDGVGDWVKAEMMDYIRSGRLVFYRTDDPKHFCPNHSRNLSFRLATKGLVVNVDTDNYMHKGFLHRLNQCASMCERRLLILPENFLPKGSKNLSLKGRFALYKEDIEVLRGFDEDLDHGYGMDDINFIFRALVARFRIARFEARYNEDRIETPMENRYALIDTEGLEVGHERNIRFTKFKLNRGMIAVNPDGWGVAKVTRNFDPHLIDLAEN